MNTEPRSRKLAASPLDSTSTKAPPRRLTSSASLRQVTAPAPREVAIRNARAPQPSIVPSSLRSLRPIAASMPVPGPVAERVHTTVSRTPRVVAFAALSALVVGGALAGVFALKDHGHHTAKVDRVSYVASGTPGLRSTATGAHERWLAGSPITFTLDPSVTAVAGAQAALTAAFAQWDTAKVGVPQVTLTADATPGTAVADGVNRVMYAPITIAGHEKDVAVTIGYADTDTGGIREADIIFNTAYPFSVMPAAEVAAEEAQQAAAASAAPAAADTSDAGVGSASKTASVTGTVTGSPGQDCGGAAYDLQNVATHEIGHVFGLGEDVTDTAATMYLRSAPCEVHKRVLTESDRDAMTALYLEPVPASAAAAAGGCGGGARISPAGATVQAALSVLGVALLFARRRRGAFRQSTR